MPSEGVVATSVLQYVAWTDRTVPPPQHVRRDLVAHPSQRESNAMRYTLSYIFLGDEEGLTIVDPGWGDDLNWDALLSLECVGGDPARFRRIVVTHLHRDHLEMAERLREASGAEVVMSRIEQEILARDPMWGMSPETVAGGIDRWGVPSDRRAELSELPSFYGRTRFRADRLVEDGDVVECGKARLRVMLTPGHTRGHMCLRDDAAAQLLTGDHLLPGVHPGLGLGWTGEDSVLDSYFESLDALSSFDRYEALPGHGYRFRGIAARAEAHRSNHLRRAAQVEAAMEAAPRASTWQIAETLTWGRGWRSLSGFGLYSALLQTEMFMRWVAAAPSEGTADEFRAAWP
jgi:glyoxylase-like metal-dependent hydrolase (beta-lactamase superfamily II)